MRKMIEGGYARKNAQATAVKKLQKKKDIDPADLVDGELDWGFKISIEDFYRITKSVPVSKFCEVQYLKYIAHLCRMSNDSLQKQVLFDERTPTKTWTKIEKMIDIDRRQIRKTMMCKTDIWRCWLESRI